MTRPTRPIRTTPSRLDRRALLRGLGASLALPPLEALARAGGPAGAGALATTASGAPLRLAFVGFPNGVNLACWRPTGTGPAFQLGKTFAPVAALKSKLQVFTGFAQRNADPLSDGPGDHARANAALLTGCHPRKTAGADIRNGISMDQVIAQKLRGVTRLPSLELISMRTRRAGACDSGYSCVYEYNVSWASETMALPAEADPRQVFERLFGAGPPRRAPAPVPGAPAAAPQRPRFHPRRGAHARRPAGPARSPQARRIPRLRPRGGTPD